MISGGLRRAIHPLLLRLWLKHGQDKELSTKIDGLTLTVRPTVFHPRFFGSSRILADYLVSTGLNGKRFLDLGTGSGIVGLFAARAGATVIAVDINPNAVECARSNATRAGLVLDCRQSDLFSSLVGDKFDVIAWNPPFFPKPVGNVGEAAFHAGQNYDVIRRFARDFKSFLTKNGQVFLILSMDLEFSDWQEIFDQVGLELLVRKTRRWGLETMALIELG